MLILIADDDTNWTELAVEWAHSTNVSPHHPDTRVFGSPTDLVQVLEKEERDLYGKAVVFLDLDFSSVGASGFDALVQLKSHPNPNIRNIPIVIYSRSDSPVEIEKCYSARANSYVHKGPGPKQRQIFLDTVSFWMNTAKLPQ